MIGSKDSFTLFQGLLITNIAVVFLICIKGSMILGSVEQARYKSQNHTDSKTVENSSSTAPSSEPSIISNEAPSETPEQQTSEPTQSPFTESIPQESTQQDTAEESPENNSIELSKYSVKTPVYDKPVMEFLFPTSNERSSENNIDKLKADFVNYRFSFSLWINDAESVVRTKQDALEYFESVIKDVFSDVESDGLTITDINIEETVTRTGTVYTKLIGAVTNDRTYFCKIGTFLNENLPNEKNSSFLFCGSVTGNERETFEATLEKIFGGMKLDEQ